MKVLIAAHYNMNNGDRALLEATIRLLNKVAPDTEIIVSAYRPDQLRDNRFETIGWAIKRGLKEKMLSRLLYLGVFRQIFRVLGCFLCEKRYADAVKSADLVFISGGHHLTDLLSKAEFYKLAVNFWIPIAFRKKVIMLPQSIGPADDKGVKDSINRIIKKVHSVAYRDNASGNFIETLSSELNARYVPDLVYTLKPNKKSNITQKTIGIALYHSYTKEKKEKILSFTLTNLIGVIDDLLNSGYSIKIIPMDEGDEQYARKIYENLKSRNKANGYFVAPKGNNIIDLINEFEGLSFVIAYKTHSVIFSIICSTPLIAVAYHKKTEEFMKEIGLEDYAIKDECASYESITSLINRLERERSNICELEKKGVENNRRLIEDYFQETIR